MRWISIALLLLAPSARAAPPPYALPFQLRPAGVGDVVRLDSALAFLEEPNGSGTTVATMLLGSTRLTPELALLVRLGAVQRDAGDAPLESVFVNPVLGAAYAPALPAGLRLAVYFNVAIPIGMGGGNRRDPEEAAAVRAGVLARSAMDNAMFAVNDVVLFPGIDLAWSWSGLTIQIEATLLELVRTRGDRVQADETKTNFTTGLHAGYFLLDWLSLGSELRYQRWLTTPAAVAMDPSARDTLSVAIGPRFHFPLGTSGWFRPALAYARGLDAPMTHGSYDIVQIDLPLSF